MRRENGGPLFCLYLAASFSCHHYQPSSGKNFVFIFVWLMRVLNRMLFSPLVRQNQNVSLSVYFLVFSFPAMPWDL